MTLILSDTEKVRFTTKDERTDYVLNEHKALYRDSERYWYAYHKNREHELAKLVKKRIAYAEAAGYKPCKRVEGGIRYYIKNLRVIK